MELLTTSLKNNPDLLAYYRLEGNGSDYTNAFNGSVNNVSFGTAYGLYGQGGSFNGASSFIRTSTVISPATNFVSMVCWVYIPSTSINGYFFKNGADNGYGLGIGSATADSPGNELLGIYEGDRWLRTGVNMGTGWHHTALTLDISGNPSIYLDGTLVYSDTGGPPGTPTTNSCIGAQGGTTRFFTGYIDDVACIDLAINTSQIKLLAAATPSNAWIEKYIGA